MSMSGRSNVELNNEQKCAMHGISHHSWISGKEKKKYVCKIWKQMQR